MPSKKAFICLMTFTAVVFFVIGAHYQHQDALVHLHELIQTDPYAFYLRRKIYGALRIFQFDEQDLPVVEAWRTPMADIMKYGFPGMDCLIVYSDFVLSFDRRNRVAHWVCEHVTSNSFNNRNEAVSRRGAEFLPDFRVPSLFRSDTNDYRKSGYDRGHLAAAGNHKRFQSHCNETFFMTNIAPQVGKGFNQDAWNKLELYVRSLAENYGSVYVCTGPLYMPKSQELNKPTTSANKDVNSTLLNVEYQLIGHHAVAVPTHFFKVIIVESKLAGGAPYMEAYRLPNRPLPNNINLRMFLCDIRDIESAAGLKFFNGLRRSCLFETPPYTSLFTSVYDKIRIY